MANDLNLVQFIGRLGKDPETRYLPSGDAVCNFSIGVGSSWKDKASGETKQNTEWVRCNVFGRLAEVCGEYLKKGKQVYVSGSLQTRKYQAKDGSDRYSTEIRLDRMQMLGGKSDGDSAPQERTTTQSSKPAPSGDFKEMDDDIPF